VKTIVITGGTKGIGLGLAHEFLKRECKVVICGRNADTTAQAGAELAAVFSADRVLSQPCDVSDLAQVQALWDAAIAKFGRVDIWINNAGVSNERKPFQELPPDVVKGVVNTNLLGMMWGCRVALTGMLAQGSGALYNMEGFGSSTRMISEGMATYGSTKAALRYFTATLVKEVEKSPVIVGFMSPGMVATEMLIGEYADDPEEWERVKRIFNILADTVETVTPFLADKTLENTKNGARIEWLTMPKVAMRFMTARFKKRDIFGDTMPAKAAVNAS
jgi:NAD(P)-dependent dehydrogenase (short-subunit alcohol dehydrogenase family)